MSTIERKAEATWKGSVTRGHGLVTTESEIIKTATYGLSSRMKGDGKETNPEELIAAAAAACFAMALSKTLGDQGAEPEEIVTRVEVGMDVTPDGPVIRTLNLLVEGRVAIDEDAFLEAVETTEDTCPVLQLLRPGFEEVTVESRLLRE